jgi:hypothetical protein
MSTELRLRVRIAPEFPELVVSDDGRIQGPKGRWLQPFPDRRGYLRINVYRKGRWSQHGVHAVVCTAFQGPRPTGAVVRHLDGNKTNNRADNLLWGTQLENEADKRRHGTSLRGECHHQAKLTTADVLSVRSSDATGAALAAQYGVSESMISAVRLRKNWRHV